MKSTTDPWTSLGLLVLRLGTGGLLLYGHGWTKLMHFGERVHRFANPIGLGSELSFVLVVFAEVVCSVLIAIGLWTRYAAVPIVIFGIVAAFFHHADDPWRRKEMALLYLVPALTLVFTGAGMFALDAMKGGKGRG